MYYIFQVLHYACCVATELGRSCKKNYGFLKLFLNYPIQSKTKIILNHYFSNNLIYRRDVLKEDAVSLMLYAHTHTYTGVDMSNYTAIDSRGEYVKKTKMEAVTELKERERERG